MFIVILLSVLSFNISYDLIDKNMYGVVTQVPLWISGGIILSIIICYIIVKTYDKLSIYLINDYDMTSGKTKEYNNIDI